MTIGALRDRVVALVQAQGYTVIPAAFNFDRQPDTQLHKAACFQLDRQGTEGFLGGDQAEQHEVTIHLAQRTRRDASGALRQLETDMSLLEAAFVGDETSGTYDYYVQDGTVTATSQDPGDKSDFVIGRFQAVLVIDRLF